MNSKHFTLAALMLAAAAGASAQVSFQGNTRPIYQETPARSTGLNAIYVLYSAAGVSMHYTAQDGDGANVTWYSYGEQGGGYAQPIAGITRNGEVTTLQQVVPEQGYIIEEGTRRTYVWVTDYSQHRLQLNSLTPVADGDCGTATLNVGGQGTDMAYYTINGVRHLLDRQLTLAYRTLTWSDTDTRWAETDTTVTEESFKSTIAVPAPLCNTTFTLSGDRFLQFWGEPLSLESDTYTTSAVDVKTTAIQAEEEHNNQIKAETSGLGGSAPVTITFTAYPTDAVTHIEWQEATDANFNNIVLRLNDLETEQTFDEAGTFYWRFIGSTAEGTCEAYSETYTVNIGTSDLKIPNVFSPLNQDGVNDVWKVSYKSIIEFHCWIFNQWGVQIKELKSPDEGWDGRYRGKLVNPGVYYYVIQARGADGQKYKRSGDINIIGFKKSNGSTSGKDTGTDTGDTEAQ